MILPQKNFCKKLVLFAIVLLLISCSQNRDLQLPKLFGDHMVLQRDKPIKVWGWANPGETVSVEFAGVCAIRPIAGQADRRRRNRRPPDGRR